MKNNAKIADLSERFLIYITEQSFLISLTSLTAAYFHIKEAFLGFFVSYKIDFKIGFFNLLDTKDGLLNIFILFLLSFIYYLLTSIFKIYIASKYELPKSKLIKILLIRDIIRAFPISNIVNSLFILKNMMPKKHPLLQYTYASMILYYSTFYRCVHKACYFYRSLLHSVSKS